MQPPEQRTSRRDRITFGDFVLDGDRAGVWVTVDDGNEWLFLNKGDNQIMMSISCAERVVELMRRGLEAVRAKPPEQTTVVWTGYSTQEQIRNLIAAMWFEYNKDQGTDLERIYRLIEAVAEIIGREIGGEDRLMKLGEAMERLGQ